MLYSIKLAKKFYRLTSFASLHVAVVVRHSWIVAAESHDKQDKPVIKHILGKMWCCLYSKFFIIYFEIRVFPAACRSVN